MWNMLLDLHEASSMPWSMRPDFLYALRLRHQAES